MNRFAKVLSEASIRLQGIKSVSDLAQLLILLREHESMFFNDKEEIRFLEEILLTPNDLHLARKFLNRRFFTLSQGSPLLLRELGVFRSWLYLAFSVNQTSDLSCRRVLNTILSLRSTNGDEIASVTSSIPLESKFFLDVVSVGFILPNVGERYWTQIEYSLVDLEREKVLLSDTFSVLPFISNINSPTGELKKLTLYEPNSGSYVRFKNVSRKAESDCSEQDLKPQSENSSNFQSKPVLGIEVNLLNQRKNPILIKWFKTGALGEAINEPLMKPLFGSEEYAILPEYYYDSYTLEIEEAVSRILLEDTAGGKLFEVCS